MGEMQQTDCACRLIPRSMQTSWAPTSDVEDLDTGAKRSYAGPVHLLGPARPRSWMPAPAFLHSLASNPAAAQLGPFLVLFGLPVLALLARPLIAALARTWLRMFASLWSWLAGGGGGGPGGAGGADAGNKLRKKGRTRLANGVAGPSNGHGGLATGASCARAARARSHSTRAQTKAVSSRTRATTRAS
jgi:hypothetical protein